MKQQALTFHVNEERRAVGFSHGVRGRAEVLAGVREREHP